MPNIRITQVHLGWTLATALKAAGKPADTPNHILWDSIVPGLGLRINRRSKTWLWRARCHGQQIGDKIGDTRLVKIEAAREAARTLIHSAKSGVDPIKAAAAKREAETAALAAAEAAQQKAEYTLRVAIDEFLAASSGVKGKHRPGYARHNRQTLGYFCKLADFVDEPIAALTRGQMLAYDPPDITPGQRRAHLEAVNRVLDRAADLEKIERNPLTADGKKLTLPGKYVARRRALGFRKLGARQIFVADELIRFWHATDKLGHPFGPLLKLLLVTGQRLREVGDMTWSELHLTDRVWVLPAERAKNGEEHAVPLSDLALQILSSLPQINRSKFVFSATGQKPVNGYSGAKLRIDRLLDDLPEWRFHDLRRSCASCMEMLRVPASVIEAALNHRSGKRGLISVYQTYSYEDEKVEGLQRWSDFLSGLLAGENVDDLIARLTGQTTDRRVAA